MELNIIQRQLVSERKWPRLNALDQPSHKPPSLDFENNLNQNWKNNSNILIKLHKLPREMNDHMKHVKYQSFLVLSSLPPLKKSYCQQVDLALIRNSENGKMKFRDLNMKQEQTLSEVFHSNSSCLLYPSALSFIL